VSSQSHASGDGRTCIARSIGMLEIEAKAILTRPNRWPILPPHKHGAFVAPHHGRDVLSPSRFPCLGPNAAGRLWSVATACESALEHAKCLCGPRERPPGMDAVGQLDCRPTIKPGLVAERRMPWLPNVQSLPEKNRSPLPPWDPAFPGAFFARSLLIAERLPILCGPSLIVDGICLTTGRFSVTMDRFTEGLPVLAYFSRRLPICDLLDSCP
jgi:hypothetical protein